MSAIKRRAVLTHLQAHRAVQVTLNTGRILHPMRIMAFEDDVVELEDGSFFSLPQVASIEPLESRRESMTQPLSSSMVTPMVSQADALVAESQPSENLRPTIEFMSTDLRASDAPAPAQYIPTPTSPSQRDLAAHSQACPESGQPSNPTEVAPACLFREESFHHASSEEYQVHGPTRDEKIAQLLELSAQFGDAVTGYEWKPTSVPNLPHRTAPRFPPAMRHVNAAKHHWGRAINLLFTRNFREVIDEFLSFSALMPSALPPLWGAAYVAEQQSDPVQALALLQWRPHLIGASPELVRAAVSLAFRVHLPETAIRILRAHARTGFERDFILQVCGLGMYRQVAEYLDEEAGLDADFETPLRAHILLQCFKADEQFDADADVDSIRSPQMLELLLRYCEDSSAAVDRAETVEQIRGFHGCFRDHELATSEKFSVGPYVQKIREAERLLDFEEARSLAVTALARAESPQWKKVFDDLLSEINAAMPRQEKSVRRPVVSTQRHGRSWSPVRSTAPLWQQASEAAIAGRTDHAIDLYQRYLDDSVRSQTWPERADPALNALAVVYNQKGQRQRAIEVMLAYRDKVQSRFRYHNQLATLYFLVGEYSKSAEEFKLAISEAPGATERQKAQKNAANARLRASQAQAQGPAPVSSESQSSDSYERELEREYLAIGVDAGIRMAEVTLAIDPFLQPDLERLTEGGTKFVGIERAQVAHKEFDYRTVKDLERRSQKEQTTQGFRSQYLASALWLVYDRNWHHSDEAQEQLPDLRLLQTRFAASLGDDAAAQGRNEVAREYYAFVLERNPNESLAIAKVRDYLRTMTGERFAAGTEKWRWEELRKLLDGEGPGGDAGSRITCWTVVHIAGLSTSAYNVVLTALDNESIRRALIGAMVRHIPGMRDSKSDFNSMLAAGVSLVNTHQGRVVEQFKRFDVAELDVQTLAAVDGVDLFSTVDTSLPHNPLDFGSQGRVSLWRATLLPTVANYLASVSPSDKELRYEIAIGAMESARQGLLAHPTRFGRRVLLPLLEQIRSGLRIHFEEWKPTVAPALALAVEGASDRDDYFELDLLITNAPQRRAAQDVQVDLRVPDWTIACTFREGGGLDGGGRKSQRWRLDKRKNVQPPATLIAIATISFRIDGEEHRDSSDIELSLRSIPFQAWRSPYHPGPPVISDSMLMGREREVALLTEGVCDTEKCAFFRIIGPRRIGKSSVVEAVRRRVIARNDPRVLVTKRFDIKGSGTHNVPLRQLLRSWASSIVAAAAPAGRRIPAFAPDPDLLITHEFLEWLEDAVRPVGHIVFLVDEFQNVAKMFDEHTLEDFLSFWKTLIERRLLSGILCGVDSMDELIAGRGFGNQFASLQTVPIGYLDPAAAQKLIEDPVPLPSDLSSPYDAFRGRSRYTPGAVRKVIDLTGGNPYFIQLICDSIVRILNTSVSLGMFVTEMVVRMAARDFLGIGADFVSRFESLTSFDPGSAFSGCDAREIEGRLLVTIALDTVDREQCDLHGKIQSWPRRHHELALLTLSRLERNQIVVSEDGGAHHKIRIGLYRLWFQQFRPFGDQPAPEA